LTKEGKDYVDDSSSDENIDYNMVIGGIFAPLDFVIARLVYGYLCIDHDSYWLTISCFSCECRKLL
jgi:hypothetical protein